jgi:hypothetical protein
MPGWGERERLRVMRFALERERLHLRRKDGLVEQK